METSTKMDDRQIRWGLSGGASVLAIGGFFWFGVSFGVVATKWGWWLWGLSTALQLGVTGSIFWAAVQLRRRSGFAPGDVGRDNLRQKATQKILRQFGWVALAQTILIGFCTSAARWRRQCGYPGGTSFGRRMRSPPGPYMRSGNLPTAI